MKAPAFWFEPPGLAAQVLRPAALVYGASAASRLRRSGRRVGVPVLCVGNVTVGGAGKTPTAIAIASLLRNRGWRPAFLTRGYGGQLAGPVRVDPERHRFPEVGDETVLLARHGPTVVARDRPAGAELCREIGADLVIMDDGLQNPSLSKDLTLAVFDAAVGIGNGLVLPAGPLRAPLAAQWPLIDAVLIVGEGRPGEAVAAEATRRGLPVLDGTIAADIAAGSALSGTRVAAFAGIGRPNKFFDTLRACGAEVVQAHAFPDHHAYGVGAIRALLSAADAAGLLPVTTEKDFARLAPLASAVPAVAKVATLPVTIRFGDREAVLRLLESRLARLSPGC